MVIHTKVCLCVWLPLYKSNTYIQLRESGRSSMVVCDQMIWTSWWRHAPIKEFQLTKAHMVNKGIIPATSKCIVNARNSNRQRYLKCYRHILKYAIKSNYGHSFSYVLENPFKAPLKPLPEKIISLIKQHLHRANPVSSSLLQCLRITT